MPTNKELKKQQDDLTEEKNKLNQQKDTDKDNKQLPDTDLDTGSPTPGSMSEGNQSNNEYGRERRQTPHRKMTITGSDDDGQAV